MVMTSRENARASLGFDGPGWIPWETWLLAWAEIHIPDSSQGEAATII